MRRVLVTGSSGQLGRCLQDIAKRYPEFDFDFAARDRLDLSDSAAIRAFFEQNQYTVIINCAAFTAVDKAESEGELAEQINHHAVGEIARAASAQSAFLVHISTDYVFDGCHYKPYAEDHPTSAPVNAYGRSKLNGERALQESGAHSAVIRTSWVYSEHGGNFVKTMLRVGPEKGALTVIDDQVGTPTYAGDLAEAIIAVVTHHLGEDEKGCTMYHFSNEGVCSWYDFARSIFELSGIDCDVSPIETKNYPTPAARPHFSLLSKQKIKQQLGLSIPYWKDSLALCLQRIKDASNA